ncbi:Putative anti-sigma factor [hydrothermal vent metagenome]|uniref:Anti-sigma factor n=1 Tax=hydrothermal vent metagenome TaxID=652676 RepID=A0A3B0T609_9ZZZZ
MDKNYLTRKWLANELSEQEMAEFKKLDDYPMCMDILEHATFFKASGFSAMADFETFSERLAMAQPPPVRKISWLRPMLRIASVFVVGFALYYFFFFKDMAQVQTLAGEKATIELPDASTVVINALSEIQYNKKMWGQHREVKLKGEAFFTVAKGAKFNVVTSQGTVSVLGTKFNVKQRGTYLEVKCYEGRVRVTSGSLSKELRAGDNFRFFEEGLTLDKNIYEHSSWTKNTSSFQRTPFYEVIAELERQYAIKITLDQVPEERLFTGGFVHGHLEDALRSLTEPLNLGYKITASDQVTLYPREK